jgi:hypothetical protein
VETNKMNLKSILNEIVDSKVRNWRMEQMRKKFNLPDNTVWVNLYHGTSIKNLKSIERMGFKEGTWFTLDKAVADRYTSQAGGKPYTMFVRVYLGALVPSGDYIVSQEPLVPVASKYAPKDLIRTARDLD